MSISSNTIFEVKWANKVAVTFKISGLSTSTFTYNSESYNFANNTYYFYSGDSFEISGMYTTSSWGRTHTPTITGLTSSNVSNSGFGFTFSFSGTYTVDENVTVASITCSF